MTNKEKMLAGEMFQSFDKELVQERWLATELCTRLNSLHPSDSETRISIYNQLFQQVGKSIFIETPFRCDYGKNIRIGSHFFANFNCVFLDSAPIQIGNHVLLGPNVQLYTSAHPLDTILRKKLFQFAQPIVIEDHVWIGGNVVINPGVTIGSNSVIGSGSVVTKSIPANVIAAGNPCRVIRENITPQ
jgi:acetyltransferase-like isoleucine patch superfamily enzyme